VRGLNTLDVGSAAYYTNVTGQPIDASGNATTAQLAMVVGSGGAIPPNAQGVHMTGNRVFGTHFGRVIGINGFKASAEALAIAGKAIGGKLLPVVFPVNISDCSGNGGLGSPRDQWPTSQPGTPHPIGQEFIVPLCKTGGGSFIGPQPPWRHQQLRRRGDQPEAGPVRVIPGHCRQATTATTVRSRWPTP